MHLPETMDLTGTLLDDSYKLARKIGAGGMGAVYLAEDLRFERQVAIKLLLPNSTNDKEYEKRFFREARLLSQLKSQNVVQFLAWGIWQENVPYLVMELLHGKSLAEHLSQEVRLNWREALEIGIQVCSGLESLHSLGIVHRDVSPANIFLCGEQVQCAKIIDLGLACSLHNNNTTDLTGTGLLMGSPHYMSPEICAGRKAEHQSDIYALGCILYELITGQKALECDNIVGLIYKHTVDYPVMLKELSPETPEVVQDIIFKAIQKKQNERYGSTTTLKNDLTFALKGEFDEIKPDVSWRKFSSFTSTNTQFRHRLPVIITIAAASVLVLLTAISPRFLKKELPTFSKPAVSKTKPKFSPRNQNIVEYINGIEARSVDPAELETLITEWIRFDKRRASEDLILLASIYGTLAEHYTSNHDSKNSDRIWNYHDELLARFKPTDANQEQVKLSRQLLSFRHKSGSDDVEVADKNLKAYFAALATLPDASENSKDVAMMLVREAKIACQKKEWTRALKAASACTEESPSRFELLDLTQTIAIQVPDAFNSQKFSVMNSSLAYLTDNKDQLSWSQRLGYEGMDKQWVGLNYAPKREPAEGDDHLLNFSRLMSIVEFNALAGKRDAARSWLNLFNRWFHTRNAELEEILADFESPAMSKHSERLIQIVKQLHLSDSKKNEVDAIKKRCLEEEALRLASLYPGFSARNNPKVSETNFRDALILYNEVKIREPEHTLQPAGLSFAELPGFDEIVDRYLVTESASLAQLKRTLILKNLADRKEFAPIRSNITRALNKLG